jgi:hypothetical protein
MTFFSPPYQTAASIKAAPRRGNMKNDNAFFFASTVHDELTTWMVLARSLASY